jgi:hydroxyacylglutathione hydrolase
VDFILEGQPEPPLYFARMKRDNKVGPKVLGELPRPAAMTSSQLSDLDTRAVALVDTRPWAVFKAGHIPGALFLPLSGSFTTDAGSMIREGEPICLLVEPSRLDEAVRDLIRIGLDDIVGYVDSGTLARYKAGGGRLASTAEIDIAEAQRRLDQSPAFVLDVRRQAEFAAGHIAGASCIAHTRLAARLDDVPKNRPVLVNCRSGARSARACALLERHGYDVTNLAGGMLAWEEAGAPVAQ